MVIREMTAKPKANAALTVMGDIKGSARSENGESAGVIQAGGICWAVLDLQTGTESVSRRICQLDRLDPPWHR